MDHFLRGLESFKDITDMSLKSLHRIICSFGNVAIWKFKEVFVFNVGGIYILAITREKLLKVEGGQ